MIIRLVSFCASYLLLGIIYLISLLPMRALHLIADLTYLVVYRMLKYRVKVVRSNLKHSFPEKNEQELALIETRFYHHLADIMVETIKSFSISEKELKKRMQLLNPELLASYFQRQIPLIAVTGHFNNWEWAAISLPLQSTFKAQGVYLALKNPVMNRFMIRSRSRFGIDLIEVRELYHEFEQRKNLLTINGFVADQSPSRPDRGYWVKFLNQETLVAHGTEKYARQYQMGVVFGKITKKKRGMYTLEYVPITDNGAREPEGEITKKHSQLLESFIKASPEQWLWSHKRWKHKKPLESSPSS
ncbi:MAG: lipid A biosynthesis acyltransferase [Bacteroidia bacterium]|nr:lipid A biosynthesis acyltransferase [Bacteroidia bacterium]